MGLGFASLVLVQILSTGQIDFVTIVMWSLALRVLSSFKLEHRTKQVCDNHNVVLGFVDLVLVQVRAQDETGL